LPKKDVPFPSGTVVSTNWVLTFFRGWDKTARDGVLALENLLVIESLEGTMNQTTLPAS
jgi:hypothetical protein